MMDFTTMHDQKFSFAIFGIKKQEVYSFLLEAETAFKELTEKAAKLEKINEDVTKLHQDKQLQCYNLEKELDELKAELKEAKETIAKLKGSNVKFAEEPKNKPFEEDEDTSEEVAEEVVDEAEEVPTIEVEAEEEEAKEVVEEVAEEAAEEVAEEVTEEVAEEPVEKKPFSYEDDDDDDVFSGEVEDKVSNAFRIGNDDDPDDGFEFL